MKRFYKIIFLIICFVTLGAGSIFAEPDTQSVEVPVVQETVAPADFGADTDSAVIETDTIIPESIPEKNAENLKKIKDSAAVSKMVNIFAGIAGFIIVIFSTVIFFKIRRRIRDKKAIVEAAPKETLASPNDFKSAVNLFLGKTDD